jgi:hypothetical protein
MSHAEIKRILHGMLMEYTRGVSGHAGQIDALRRICEAPDRDWRSAGRRGAPEHIVDRSVSNDFRHTTGALRSTIRQRPDLSDRVVDPLQISELGEAPQLCAR